MKMTCLFSAQLPQKRSAASRNQSKDGGWNEDHPNIVRAMPKCGCFMPVWNPWLRTAPPNPPFLCPVDGKKWQAIGNCG